MSQIKSVKEVKIGINFGKDTTPVGRLAIRDRRIYFEYYRDFIDRGLEISPLHLPLKSGVSSFDHNLFEGLPGVFNDSLPDGWGRLLFDRFIRSHGVLPSDITTLDRLAHVGHRGMGALVYEPDHGVEDIENDTDLDVLATQALDVLNGTSDSMLAKLIALNGSSAGARPKALIGVNETRNHIIHCGYNLPDEYSHWIVKFHNMQDGNDAGAIEYVYALMAKEAGITMPDVHLFSAKKGAGYFAIKRFDRDDNKRYHMHTACGLLHSDFRTPSLDYEDLMALTGALTRDVREIEKMYQLAVFNVLAHNRDDHAKNFSFLMDNDGQWKLSPAYDITFSSGPQGEQSTTVMGEGRNPRIENLVSLGKSANIARMHDIIDKTRSSIARWPKFAAEYGVHSTNIKLISNKLKEKH